jgi:heme/copper-type cytochrome/quinol oxidase subunit 4
MNLLKRLMLYYNIDLILAIVFTIIAFMFVYDNSALLSAMARKIALASIGLVYYYITRFIKLGHIEWSEPYDKIYSLTLLIYMAIVISFG